MPAGQSWLSLRGCSLQASPKDASSSDYASPPQRCFLTSFHSSDGVVGVRFCSLLASPDSEKHVTTQREMSNAIDAASKKKIKKALNSAIFFPTQSLQFSRKFPAVPLPNPRPPCPQPDDPRNENFKRVNVLTNKLRAALRAFLPLCKAKTTRVHATNPTGTVPPHNRHPHPERNGASRENPPRPPPARLSCGVAEIRRRVEKEKTTTSADFQRRHGRKHPQSTP